MNPQGENQEQEPRDINRASTRVYRTAVVLSWMAAASRITTKVIFWIIAFFVVKGMLQGDTVVLLGNTLGSCLTNNEKGTCYSGILENFFPLNNTAGYRHLVCQITPTGEETSKPDHKMKLPLVYDNFLVLLIASIVMAAAYWLLDFADSLLIDAANTADAAAPELYLQEKQDGAPPAITSN
jgi:hypothetical protein